jgi:hypothetical protein
MGFIQKLMLVLVLTFLGNTVHSVPLFLGRTIYRPSSYHNQGFSVKGPQEMLGNNSSKKFSAIIFSIGKQTPARKKNWNFFDFEVHA